MAYEVVTFQALCDQLRCLDPSEFITTLQQEMRAELAALDDELPRLGWCQRTGHAPGRRTVCSGLADMRIPCLRSHDLSGIA
jgi:hypothetical protein